MTLNAAATDGQIRAKAYRFVRPPLAPYTS